MLKPATNFWLKTLCFGIFAMIASLPLTAVSQSENAMAYDVAILEIQNNEASAIIVKNNQILVRNTGRGIIPLLKIYDNQPQALDGGILVDKVIGRAAAFIAIDGKAVKVYGDLMSQEALDLLEKHKIQAAYGKLVPQILNRKQDDLCPMEKAVLGINSSQEAVKLLRDKVKQLSVNNNTFTITSSDFETNTFLDKKQEYSFHSCSGSNISPQLSWHNIPQGTESFALICHDPDAPREHGWYHWLIINIPATITSIESGGKIADATETINDFKQYEYGGPCPPIGHGIHHYNFTIYALDTKTLDLTRDSSPIEVEKAVRAHAIAQATITGLYERQ